MADVVPQSVELFRSMLSRLAESANKLFVPYRSEHKRMAEQNNYRLRLLDLQKGLPSAATEMGRLFGQKESGRLTKFVTQAEQLMALSKQAKFDPQAATDGHLIVEQLTAECRRIQNLSPGAQPTLFHKTKVAETWIHQPADDPPHGFLDPKTGSPFQSVIGTREEIGYTLRPNGANGVSATQLRSSLQQQAEMPRPKIFLRHAPANQIEAFYRTFSAAEDAMAAITEYRSTRPKAIGDAGQRKSTKAADGPRLRISTKSTLKGSKRRR